MGTGSAGIGSGCIGSAAIPWTLVVAMTPDGVIGRGGGLPWRLRADLRRFKRRTMGNCLLMGRKTFDSIGRPLPGRQTIVLSKSGIGNARAGITVVDDIANVNANVEPNKQVMVVGGAEIYRLAIERCTTLWVTRVLAEIDGDVFFPEIDWNLWSLDSTEGFDEGPNDQWPTEFQTWNRKNNSRV